MATPLINNENFINVFFQSMHSSTHPYISASINKKKPNNQFQNFLSTPHKSTSFKTIHIIEASLQSLRELSSLTSPETFKKRLVLLDNLQVSLRICADRIEKSIKNKWWFLLFRLFGYQAKCPEIFFAVFKEATLLKEQLTKLQPPAQNALNVSCNTLKEKVEDTPIEQDVEQLQNLSPKTNHLDESNEATAFEICHLESQNDFSSTLENENTLFAKQNKSPLKEKGRVLDEQKEESEKLLKEDFLHENSENFVTPSCDEEKFDEQHSDFTRGRYSQMAFNTFPLISRLEERFEEDFNILLKNWVHVYETTEITGIERSKNLKKILLSIDTKERAIAFIKKCQLLPPLFKIIYFREVMHHEWELESPKPTYLEFIKDALTEAGFSNVDYPPLPCTFQNFFEDMALVLKASTTTIEKDFLKYLSELSVYSFRQVEKYLSCLAGGIEWKGQMVLTPLMEKKTIKELFQKKNYNFDLYAKGKNLEEILNDLGPF